MPGPDGVFVEEFVWQGNHASTIRGPATTQWWDEDAWGVRTDTSWNAVSATA